MQRRQLLRYSLGSLGALTLSPGLARQAFAQAPSGASTLGEQFRLLPVGGSNVLAFTGAEDGLWLVDSGAEGHEQVLRDSLSRIDDRAVTRLFNTHWHREQCGGNAVLGEAGARITAHKKTRRRLSTTLYLPHEQRYQEALPEPAWPTDTFHHKASVSAGTENIDYGYMLEAHTDGDIYVYFRDSNVIAVGDVVSPERDPALDWYGGAWIGGRVDALDLLLSMTDADTRFVPAHGPVVGRKEVEVERDMLATVYDRLVGLVREGCGADCMYEEGALDGLSREWRDPHTFLYAAYKGIWAHHSRIADNIV